MSAVVAINRTGACALCRERAICAVIRLQLGDVELCTSCLTGCAALIASRRPSSARPHKQPCVCMECFAFDEGQHGGVVLDYVEPERNQLELATLERARRLEVDG